MKNCTDCGEKKSPCGSKPCGCPVKNLGAECVTYKPDNLLCSGIPGNDTLENIIKAMDVFICNKFEDMSNFGDIANIGVGAELYKGVNQLGQKEIKTITSSDDSLTIVENENEVDITGGGATLKTIGDGNPVYIGENTDGVSEISSIKDISENIHIPTYKGYQDGNHNFAGITSETFTVEEDTNGNISINTPNFGGGVRRFIVNNLYQGNIELGTVSNPFKNIQNAITAFVGNGNRDLPEHRGGFIIVQNGSPYNFNGDFSYRDINIILEEGATVNHNPTGSNSIMDLTILDETQDVYNTVYVFEGASLRLYGDGFINKGVTPTATTKKRINLSGTRGQITLNSSSNPVYGLIKANAENENYVRNTTGGLFEVSNLMLQSLINPLIRTGVDSSIYINEGVDLRINSSGNIPFEFNGGICEMFNTLIQFSGSSQYAVGMVLNRQLPYETELRMYRCTVQTDAVVDVLFYKQTTVKNDQPALTVKYTNDRFGKITSLFSSPTRETNWERIDFAYNDFTSPSLVPEYVDLTQNNTRSTSNVLNGQLITSLREYADKSSAIAAGVPAGGIFLNTTTDLPDIVV